MQFAFGQSIRFEVAVRCARALCAFAAALVDCGEVDVDDNALFLAAAVHDELLGGASRLRDDVFNFHVVLPELEPRPVSSFVPGEQKLVGGDAVVC